ncbi:sodium:calcium antiporter [Chloroflexota bacterium]
MVWLKFVLCVVIILFAGTKLARYGDAIAEKTGLGGIWIGLVLLATITSIPELVTGVSSVALIGQPDLAIGTLFGSCLFNLAILALLDILHRRTPVLSEVRLRHIASAGVGILLIAVAAASIFTGERFSGLALGWIGIPSIIISILYLVTVWGIFRLERGHQSQSLEAAPHQYKDISTRMVYLKFTLTALAVIGAGIWVSFIGDEIAVTYKWDASFVGSLFLAISSSMPELVVAIAALRLGALNMAIADILGSNMFNIAIIFPVDLFYTQGTILSSVSSVHLTTATVAIVMSLLVIIGLRFRQKRKTFIVISWYGIALIGFYIFGTYALFKGIG